MDTQRYLITLSAYIHNNVLDITGYEKCPEKYKYSSLKVYLGLEKRCYRSFRWSIYNAVFLVIM